MKKQKKYLFPFFCFLFFCLPVLFFLPFRTFFSVKPDFSDTHFASVSAPNPGQQREIRAASLQQKKNSATTSLRFDPWKNLTGNEPDHADRKITWTQGDITRARLTTGQMPHSSARDTAQPVRVAAADTPDNREFRTISDDHIRGDFLNYAKVELKGSGRRTFHGKVDNHGTIKVTDTTVVYREPVTNLGAYISDPSNNYFTDLIIGDSGYLVGGEGDNFFVLGDLISSSTMTTNWNTTDAALTFLSGLDNSHDFSLTGADIGPLPAGFDNNFAWGTLTISSGNTLALQDGNTLAGGALYVEVLSGALTSGATITNITGNGLNIYYAADMPGNAYLAGATYDLAGGGQLLPISPYCPGSDLDRDGICDDSDNCLSVFNSDQIDSDADGLGNACDACPNDPANDVDSDGVCGDTDNCPTVANPSQLNSDFDTRGDACDICPFDPSDDIDGDGYCANNDNCPLIFNPGQEDTDSDGHGDLCPLADFDQDGDVDGTDLSLFSGYYTLDDPRADLDEDTFINGTDVGKFAREYGWYRVF